MKEHPILFSGAMVRAILEGRKTQTRRVMKDQPPQGSILCYDVLDAYQGKGYFFQRAVKIGADLFHQKRTLLPNKGKPRYKAGDRLWVREIWGVGTRPDPAEGWRDGIEYKADELYLEEHDDLNLYEVTPPDGADLCDYWSGWHPSIHMPRLFSRITLEVTAVRVERVRDISEEDAQAEGCENNVRLIYGNEARPIDYEGLYAVERFENLWDSINAKRGYSWESNPWVWVIEFERE